MGIIVAYDYSSHREPIQYTLDDRAYKQALKEIESFRLSVPNRDKSLKSESMSSSVDAKVLYQQENLRLNTIHSLSDVKKHFNQQS